MPSTAGALRNHAYGKFVFRVPGRVRASKALEPQRPKRKNLQEYTLLLIRITVETRMNAIQNLFLRWDTLGYNKRHAKSAFKSKEFGKYLDQIGFYQADYMLLMVD